MNWRRGTSRAVSVAPWRQLTLERLAPRVSDALRNALRQLERQTSSLTQISSATQPKEQQALSFSFWASFFRRLGSRAQAPNPPHQALRV